LFSESVRCLVVVGAQWGDEGKGKLVDVLAEQATIVARYQGGANAGHTVRVEEDEFILHLIPSGVLYPNTRCLLGNGVVVDPWTLSEEMHNLRARGIDLDGRLGLSKRAHLVLPYHRALDQAHEGSREDEKKIGTTGRGIGPAYRDKVTRIGVRVGDLTDAARTREMVEAGCAAANATLERLGADLVRPEEVLDALDTVRETLLGLATDTGHEIRTGLASGGRVLLEGAQGALLDVDHGTYPFVTSSTTTAGGAAAGVGIGPTLIDEVLGVVKAYTTRVGNGPLPTELQGDEAERLRQLGGEFGATTGRPRRPGWFDANVVRYAAGVNGLTALAVTKLDVLDTFDEIRLATGYELDGEPVGPFPDSVDELARVDPVYADYAGWESNTTECRSWGELPAPARTYLRRLEAESTVPIRYVSIGAARRETIKLEAGGVAALS
jgi:adenylosuccinate synthase